MLNELSIFQGETTIASGRIYARLPTTADNSLDPATFRLAGTIYGPHSRYASTLPAKVAFREVTGQSSDHPQRGLLIETIVPDPCTWSIDRPSLYEVHLQLFRGDDEVAESTRLFGFRRFGIVGRDFLHEGKRWVLRGANTILPSQPDQIQSQLTAYRESRLVCVCDNPPDNVCRESSELGTMLLADLTRLGSAEVQNELLRIGQWPAVIGAVLAADVDAVVRDGIRNFALGSALQAKNSTTADFYLWEFAETKKSSQPVADRPVVARRIPSASLPNPSELRQHCERLQRDVAPSDYAGYLV